MALNEPTEGTAGENFDSSFGSNDPRRRSSENQLQDLKKKIKVDLTVGQSADDIDSTRKMQPHND
jgi:hypothetical protein